MDKSAESQILKLTGAGPSATLRADMPKALLAVLVLLSACAKPLEYAEYKDETGAFTVEAPKDWQPDVSGPFPEWPARKTQWLGAIADQHEGVAIGAMFTVWRMDRKPTKKQKKYQEQMLAATDALFEDEQPEDVMTAAGELAGYPARAFQRELTENLGGGLHGAVRSHPSRISGVAVQTEHAYFVLEYRATLALFDKHLPTFQRMRETFKPGK